ncbi:DNA nucleotidylexotransferase [Strongylocentrotus purpuratus]|uniref:DNA-directed DNA/RNA polymerase mu n=1 Tax=Strongylocentrotus purpuratus TaxID=7668 RepID=A0A7M7RGU7_STRPU|nr:DNA nucleotidylexotransferase [Strongylocentrotus purpuratus]
MAAPEPKRRKHSHNEDSEEFPVKFPDVIIFIVNARIQKVRLKKLRHLGRSKGFVISSELNESVTHVVTELNSRDHVISVLQRICKSQRNTELNAFEFAQKAELLSLKWYTSCMEEDKPVEITDEHRVSSRKPLDPDALEEDGEDKPKNRRFACQRITPLNHPNQKFTEALEFLEKAAELRMGDNSRSRALAFRKASAALKALPEEIKKPEDVENLYDIRGGAHCKGVILDILENGYSAEVEGIKRSDWYQNMSLFTGIYGCGISTSAKWCQMGLRSLDDVKGSYILNLTRSQLKGIEYYNDLNTPVTKEEAKWIHDAVSQEVAAIQPGSTVVMTGGFLRGKDMGHDVDFLISHPEEGKEKGILGTLLQALTKKGLLDYTDIQNSTVTKTTVQTGMDASRNTMDHYERCFSIFRLPKTAQSHRSDESSERTVAEDSAAMDVVPPASESSPSMDVTPANGTAIPGLSLLEKTNGSTTSPSEIVQKTEDSGRSWVARRVDFVIAPAGQYAFALLGWTGSKMFNRSMRDYTNKVMNMNLSSHGLFDKTNNCSLQAKTEEEIFELLKLDYKPPEERNC